MFWNFSLKKRVVMIEGKNWQWSVFFGLIVGLFYAFLLSNFKFSGMNINLNYLGIALSIAMTEELVFSGFVFGFLSRYEKNSLLVLVFSAILAAGSHIPMMLFGYELNFSDLIPSLLFVFGYSLINISIRAGTGNVLGSIVARILLVLVIA